MKKNFKNKKAFSLIELSIVILIVGIIVAGVTQSSRLIGAFKLSSARNLTQSSPVASMKNLTLWWETTSSASFLDSEADDTQKITTWYDINPTSTTKYNIGQSTTNYKPIFTVNCINSLPCIRFDGTDDYLTTSTGDISGSELTVFVVAKRRAAVAHTTVIGAYNSTASSDYDNTSSFIGFYEGLSSNTLQSYRSSALSSATHPGNNIPYIAETIWNGTNNIVYLNGVAQSSSASSGNFNSSIIVVGVRWVNSILDAYYNGYVAEIIIFSRALKNEERDAIETYLGKKWGIVVI